MRLREYQERAVSSVRSAWQSSRSVCLVAPTGAGKTVLGQALIEGSRALWVAHRRELVEQAAKRIGAGVIAPGYPANPKALVQVGTVQTLLARGSRPPADVIVLDEAHHYMAAEWRAFVESYPDAKVLGLTATPQRADGEPLGDIFDSLVVAAPYSELVRDGYLVTARVYRPAVNLGNDLAMDPVDAWVKYSEGSRAFLFCGRVSIANDIAARFRGLGIIAKTIEADTPKRERDDALAQFRSGHVKVLTNVYALTEGVDVPEARTVILARAFGHVGSYLQAVGRVMRPAKDKLDAILVDLTGTSIKHGLPTQDREYSLSARPISGELPERDGVGGGGGGFDQSIRGMELLVAHPGAGRDSAQPSRCVRCGNAADLFSKVHGYAICLRCFMIEVDGSTKYGVCCLCGTRLGVNLRNKTGRMCVKCGGLAKSKPRPSCLDCGKQLGPTARKKGSVRCFSCFWKNKRTGMVVRCE